MSLKLSRKASVCSTSVGSGTLPRAKRRLSGTWASLSSIIRRGIIMGEGRRSQVVLLDERRLDLLIQPKLYAGELLDLVASHFHLKEKEYFGIAYPNDTGQYSWLQLDKRVLEHDFPKKSSSSNAPPLTLYFRIKYFVESISQLRDSATVEAFYLQVKSLLSKGDLEADSEVVFQLAALVLQATYGDFVDESLFKTHLRRLPILPAFTLKECTSIVNCEDKVLKEYKTLVGQSRGEAIVNYLKIAETLPTYGQHYYEVKDKAGNHCWLGLSYKGISQCDKHDRRSPTRVFLWKQLENLYFRDKKFTIEVHEARRVIHTLSSFNLYEDAIEEPVEEFDDLSDAICDPTTQVSVSRRTLAPANVTVYVWYATSAVVTKCIWSMAIAQHHFFLDRRQRKSQGRSIPSLSQIERELCRSIQSLSSAGSQSNLSRSTSSSSLPSTILGGELSEESKAATIEMLTALRARKNALEEALQKKNEELKSLCLKEGELTGEIPPEIPLLPGEERPQVRRRIGTSFLLSEKWISKSRSTERETLSDLELECEIQGKIASAALQLANDCTARKSVRKQRKTSYTQATAKLRNLELKLQALRRLKAVAEKREQSHDGSECSISSLEKGAMDGGSQLNFQMDSSSSHSASETGTLKSYGSASVPPCASLPQLTVSSPEASRDSPRQRHQSLRNLSSRGSESQAACGWSVTSYCPGIEFDTISCSSGSNISVRPLRTPYRNRFEANLDIEGSNLYSVPNRRASQVFDSQDDLLLSSRKSDYDKRSPSATIPSGTSHHHQYSNALPLSASYDERLWCAQNKELGAASKDPLLDDGYCKRSGNDCDMYFSQGLKPSVVELRNPRKLHHFYSENSLHREELDSYNQMDVVKPVGRMAHVQSVPQLHEESGLNSRELPPKLINNSSHSLNQVAELVNASKLRQGVKKSSMLGSLSAKTKTKGWIETSLDSPPPPRKNKNRSNITSLRMDTKENTCPVDSHSISLSPYPTEKFFEGAESNVQHDFALSRLTPRFCDTPSNLWPSIETASIVICRSPSPPPVCKLQQVPTDDGHIYENVLPVPLNEVNSSYPGSVSVMVNSDCHNTSREIYYPEIPPAHPDLHYSRTEPPLRESEMSSNARLHQLSRNSIETLPQSPGYMGSNVEHLHYTESIASNVSEELASPLSPCNGAFPYPEVNVVSVGHFQPYWEETKPYETSDFYKYSTKHRKSLVKSPEPSQGMDDLEKRQTLNVSMDEFQNSHDSSVQRNSVVMNAHVAIIDHHDYEPIEFNSMYENELPRNVVASPASVDGNASFGEVGIRVSVADTFHEEMLAWYENRDSVKKATLV